MIEASNFRENLGRSTGKVLHDGLHPDDYADLRLAAMRPRNVRRHSLKRDILIAFIGAMAGILFVVFASHVGAAADAATAQADACRPDCVAAAEAGR